MTKTDFEAKLLSLNTKITSNENELKKLKTFDSSYFRDKNHVEEDRTQNYLVFQAIERYFKVTANTQYISSWKSKELSDESIKPSATSDNSFTLSIDYLGNKIRVKFDGGCLKQPKFSYNHSAIVNIYIVYKLGASSPHTDDPTLKNCLFGAVTLTKIADIDKYIYSGYGIGFDRKSSFSFPNGRFGQNLIIFGADNVDNKKKDIFALRKGPTQGLEHTLTAEKCIRLILQW